MRRVLILTVLTLMIAALWSAGSRAAPGDTTRVSVDNSGAQGGEHLQSLNPAASSDGRFIAFESYAALVADDANGALDIYVRDRLNGTTVRVSVESDGGESGGYSYAPSISASGRYVAFHSAGTLTPDDQFGDTDIYVRDRDTDGDGLFDEADAVATVRISVPRVSGERTGHSSNAAISPNGRFVAFTSAADNLVAGDTNAHPDIFLRDRDSDNDGVFDEPTASVTSRVSVGSGGAQTNAASDRASVSADGRFIAFESAATTLVSGDTNGHPDIFVRDRSNAFTRRINLSGGGAQANGVSGEPMVSGNGQVVAFQSIANNLITGDTNNVYDIFIAPVTGGGVSRVSVTSAGGQAQGGSFSPSISQDGRYVAFHSVAGNLVPGDTGAVDIFVRDRTAGSTTRASVGPSNAQANGNSASAALSGNGQVVAFESHASNLVTDDTNLAADAFSHEMAYPPPPPTWTPGPTNTPRPSPTGTAVPDIIPTGMEVSQGTQDLNNSMPLVATRMTLVRGYARSSTGTVAGVTARLRAFRDGVELPGSPRPAERAISVALNGGNRLRLDDGFLFYLPLDWREGTVTLRLEVNPEGSIPDGDPTNNTLERTVTFHPGQGVNLAAVPIHLHNDSGGDATYYATDPTFQRIVLNLLRFHPITGIHVWPYAQAEVPGFHGFPFYNEWTWEKKGPILEHLEWKNFWTEDPLPDMHWMGMGHPDASYGGKGNLPGREFVTSMAGPDPYTVPSPHRIGIAGWTVAHELGHNKARRHAYCSGTEVGADPDYPWPHPNCKLAEVDPAGYFGLDVYHRTWGLEKPYIIGNDPTLPDMQRGYPFMGYQHQVWVSPYEYCKLLPEYGVPCSLYGAPEAPAAAPEALRALEGAAGYIAASGLITVTTGQAEWGALYRLDEPPAGAVAEAAERLREQAAARPNGLPTYTLAQLNAGGTVLAEQALFIRDDGHEPDVLNFFELVPLAEGATRVQIRDGATVLAERIASAQPPTVQLIEPNGGALQPGTVVRWQAADPDNPAALGVDLLYSADNGNSWQLVARQLTGSSYTLATLADLPGSAQGRLRVVANDGFNTVHDDSDGPLTVPGSAPFVMLVQPAQSLSVEAGTLLVLQGMATDREDGVLTGAALVWRSDRDGPLGTGEEIATAALSPGVHRVTLTATDQDGQSAAASVTVVVGSIFLPLISR